MYINITTITKSLKRSIGKIIIAEEVIRRKRIIKKNLS